MLFFGNIKNTQAETPVRKPSCIVHPENAPRTIPNGGYPKDFSHYEYTGATIEMVARKGSDGETVRRPALVARMVNQFRTEEGAYVVEEMTASAKDLSAGHHPNADAITAALNAFYENKIPAEQREPNRASFTQSAQVFTLQSVAENQLFKKLNAAS